ncbi:MAG TPA: hypothetical protein VNG12_16520, partial [Acidimicrobiales bacterium]|nr:hypothetical protein [Acidimicrobiales bacterium]
MTLTPRRLPGIAIPAVAGLLLLASCGTTHPGTTVSPKGPGATVSAKRIVKVEISSNQAVVNGGEQA